MAVLRDIGHSASHAHSYWHICYPAGSKAVTANNQVDEGSPLDAALDQIRSPSDMRRWRLDRRIRIEAFYLRRTSRPASHAGSHLPNHRPWMGGDAARSLTAMAATPAAISIRRRSLAVAGRAVAAGQTIRRGRAVGSALPVGRRGDRVRAGRVRGGALVGGVWRPEGIGDDGQQRRWIDAVFGCPSGEAPTVVVGEAGQVCRRRPGHGGRRGWPGPGVGVKPAVARDWTGAAARPPGR